MPDTPEPTPPSVQEVQQRLDAVARTVEKTHSLDADSRRILGELVAELRAALKVHDVPPVELAHLADSAAHLAESLRKPHNKGLLEKARDRFDSAVIEAEAHAPVAVGLARQFLDALANIGI